MANLVIDKVVMHETPQSGTWLYCFSAQSGHHSAVFHVPHEKYSGDGIEISMGLVLPNVSEGGHVSWTMRLDDDEADVCSERAEDKCSGSFIAAIAGGQHFGPMDDWNFTLHWRLV